MLRLFGHGRDPSTGVKLGRAYPVYTTPDERANARIAALPASLTKEQHETLIAQIRAQEHSRVTPAAVSGFDLTFTVPKSASIRWALGDTKVQAAIAQAHAEAVADAITFLEAHALFTRIGTGSIAQVQTRGAVAAAFDHWDTRTGDPNLHTHVVLANKVQGPDGAWRALDSRALYQAAVAISEIYDDLFADRLHARLPAVWAWRDRGARRSPAYELDDVDDRLIREFSTRAITITEGVRAAVGEFTHRHGRTPSRPEVLRMRQRVTRSTRPVKIVGMLADQLANWHVRAEVIPEIPRRAPESPPPAIAADSISPDTLTRLAATVLDGVQRRRSTWTRWNVLAETARVCRAIRTLNPDERHLLHEKVTNTALSACTQLTAPDVFTVPPAYQRPDGESVFTRHHEDRHTSRTILDAEARLLSAHRDLSGPVAGAEVAGDHHQTHAIRTLATSGRRVDVLVGAAGSGKTTVLQRFRQGWEEVHGAGSVIGLAPSATAARELGASLGIACENTAKWLHETGRPSASRHWQIRAGQVVIVDEASLAGTLALDRIVTQAGAVDGKVVLVGDHRQLGAVEAGGAFGLLATWGEPVELAELWRFRQAWEAVATLQLRAGKAGCLDSYNQHGRLHQAPWELAIDTAYQAARAADAEGRTALLVAVDTVTVDTLNARARADRLAAGTVTSGGVAVPNGSTIGVGDRIVSRRNDRRLCYGDEFVRNGTLWDVVAVHPDGSLDTRSVNGPGTVLLPPKYVQEHVELGYASTLHRAQGMTVDSAHVIATPGVTREALYVGMSRGRDENHCYLATDVNIDADGVPEPDADPRATMEAILARTGAELSAIQTLADAREAITSPEHLGSVTATVLAEAATQRWTTLLPELGFPADVVRRIRISPARGPLITMLQNGMLAGLDVTAVMQDLASSHVDGDPAEFLHSRVGQWLRNHETVDQALTPREARDQHVLQYLRDGDDSDTGALLTQLHDMAQRRLAGVRPDDYRPAWLPLIPTLHDVQLSSLPVTQDPAGPIRSPQP